MQYYELINHFNKYHHLDGISEDDILKIFKQYDWPIDNNLIIYFMNHAAYPRKRDAIYNLIKNYTYFVEKNNILLTARTNIKDHQLDYIYLLMPYFAESNINAVTILDTYIETDKICVISKLINHLLDKKVSLTPLIDLEPRDYVVAMTFDGPDHYRTFNVIKYCLESKINNIQCYITLARSLDLSIDDISSIFNKEIELKHISFEN